MVHHYFVVPMPFSYEEPAFPTHLKNYFPFLSPWSNNQLDKMYCNNGTNGNGNGGGGHRIAEPDRESIAQLEKNVHSTLSHLTFPQPPNFHLANLRCPTVSVEFKRVAGTTFYSVTVPLGSKNIQAEDLKVTLKDTVVTVEGMKRETKIVQKSEFEPNFQPPPQFLGQKLKNSSSECQTSQCFEKFTKKVTLPPNVNLKKVKVQFSSKGCLKIEAPLIQVQHHHDAKASTFANSNLTTSTADLSEPEPELSGDENTRIRHEIAILKI